MSARRRVNRARYAHDRPALSATGVGHGLGLEGRTAPGTGEGGCHLHPSSPHGGVRPQRRAQVPDACGTIVERGRTGAGAGAGARGLGVGGDGRSLGRGSVRALAIPASADVMIAKGSGPVDGRDRCGRGSGSGSGRGRGSGAWRATGGRRAGVLWRIDASDGGASPAALRTARGTYTRESHRPQRVRPEVVWLSQVVPHAGQVSVRRMRRSFH